MATLTMTQKQKEAQYAKHTALSVATTADTDQEEWI
jgi:hypothetical protein